MAAKKPTAQQIAQAKARAGGNNPIKVTKAGVKRLGTAALIASNFLPVGRAAKIASRFASASKATKLSSGASKIKTKKFIQGDRARITNTPPKKTKVGPNSPVRGTRVDITYKTKELTPKQQATLTTGRTVRERTKKAGTYAKGAVTGAYVMNEIDKAKAKKKK